MTAPKYNPNVPQQPDSPLSVTQGSILSNFQALSDIFKVNHVPLEETAANIGNHIFAQLLEQSHAIETQFGEITAYTKDANAQTDQVFLRYQGNGQEFQYTNYQLYSVDANNFFTFLPGRVLVYFGIYTQVGTLGDKRKNLVLRPGVAVNIISVNYCPNTATVITTGGSPSAIVMDAIEGKFTQINLGTLLDKQSAFYIVAANV